MCAEEKLREGSELREAQGSMSTMSRIGPAAAVVGAAGEHREGRALKREDRQGGEDEREDRGERLVRVAVLVPQERVRVQVDLPTTTEGAMRQRKLLTSLIT
jgi:hypothetical protein